MHAREIQQLLTSVPTMRDALRADMFAQVKDYVRATGILPAETGASIRLGRWLRSQRTNARATLSSQAKEMEYVRQYDCLSKWDPSGNPEFRSLCALRKVVLPGIRDKNIHVVRRGCGFITRKDFG